MSIDGTMPASAELPYRHSSALGYEYPLGRTLRLLHQFSEGETGPSVRAADLLQLENRLLDLLNVKYVVGNTYHASAQTLLRAPDRFKLLARDGTVELFENVQVLPRAFLVPMSGVRAARSPEEAFQRVVDRSFDPAVEAVVEGDLAPLAAAGAGPAGEARLVVTRGINRLSVIADVPAPSLLVISDGWYPGWRATVDGRSADVLVTNYAFKGVVLPAGRHEVALRFLPRSFILGLAVSVATIALLLVSVGAARRRRVTATPSSV
jgi:hypothetical protein